MRVHGRAFIHVIRMARQVATLDFNNQPLEADRVQRSAQQFMSQFPEDRYGMHRVWSYIYAKHHNHLMRQVAS